MHNRLGKPPSIMWQQPCPPGCWASPQTLYLQMAGPDKPCQLPWRRVTRAGTILLGWVRLGERVALPACFGMISSETVRKVSQTITSAKQSPNTSHSQKAPQRDTSQDRDQVTLIQTSALPLSLSSPSTNGEHKGPGLVPCQG